MLRLEALGTSKDGTQCQLVIETGTSDDDEDILIEGGKELALFFAQTYLLDCTVEEARVVAWMIKEGYPVMETLTLLNPSPRHF